MIRDKLILEKIMFARDKIIKSGLYGDSFLTANNKHILQYSQKDRAVILPLTGGIDSTLLFYELAYGKLNMNNNFKVPASRIKIMSFVHSYAKSSSFDIDWLTDFVNSKEYTITKTMAEFFNCNPWSAISSNDRVSVEAVSIRHNIASGDHPCNRFDYYRDFNTTLPVRTTFFQLACIPSLSSVVNGYDTVLLGLLKGEEYEIQVDIQNLEKNLNDLLTNVIKPSLYNTNAWRYGNGSSNLYKSQIRIIMPLIEFNKAEVTTEYNTIVPKCTRMKANLFISKKDKLNVEEKKYQRYIKHTDDPQYLQDSEFISNRLRTVRRAFNPIIDAILHRRYNKAMRILCESVEALHSSTDLYKLQIQTFAFNIIRRAAEDERTTKRTLTILINMMNKSKI